MVKRVCLVSSGTGGHLMPALVLSEALREAGHETCLLTEGRAVERELLERAGCESVTMPAGRAGLGQLVRLPKAAYHARRFLREKKTDFVISTGGRTSVPVGFAAKSLGLPLFLLEQNAIAGRSNRLLMPIANRIYLGLPPLRQMAKAVVTGTPLRQQFTCADRRVARESLGLNNDSPVVLVTGGSQGAKVLNELIPDVLCALGRKLQVVHLSGAERDEDVRRRYAKGEDRGLRAIVRVMALDMASLYAAADLVICRGGGCTVAELMAVGRAAVVIPYPDHEDRQQCHNGEVLERAGAARVIEQADLTAPLLQEVLDEMFGDPDCLVTMGDKGREISPPNASAAILADLSSMHLLN